MINGRPIPSGATVQELAAAILEVMRRAIDGTVYPLFVDETNGRVIFFGVSSVRNGTKVQIQAGDLEFTTAGKGVILKDENGSGKTCRVTGIYDAESRNWVLNLTGLD